MIKPIMDWLVYEIFKMPRGAILSEAVNFFLYDTVKIFLLLIVIIFIVSIIRTFFSKVGFSNLIALESPVGSSRFVLFLEITLI